MFIARVFGWESDFISYKRSSEISSLHQNRFAVEIDQFFYFRLYKPWYDDQTTTILFVAVKTGRRGPAPGSWSWTACPWRSASASCPSPCTPPDRGSDPRPPKAYEDFFKNIFFAAFGRTQGGRGADPTLKRSLITNPTPSPAQAPFFLHMTAPSNPSVLAHRGG